MELIPDRIPDPVTDPVTDPITDLARLTTVSRLDITSPDARARLDDLAGRAAQLCGLPIGLVNIVLDTAQYAAGRYGLEGWIAEAEGVPVEWSFCAQAVRSRSSYVVEDALDDERQRHNPLVTEDGIRCYAGWPLIASDGQVLGALCVVGTQPRNFGAELQALEGLAADTVSALEGNVPGA